MIIMKRLIIILIVLIISLNICFGNITTNKIHYIEEKNIVYISLDEKISKNFIVSLKDEKQSAIIYFKQNQEIIQNNNETYKIYINYPENFKTGKYSIIVQSYGNIETSDIDVKHIGIWQKIKIWFENIFS